MKWWDEIPWSQVFPMLSFRAAFSLSSFTFIKRLFSSALFAFRVVSSAYLKLLIFLLAILIPACDSSYLAFCMIFTLHISWIAGWQYIALMYSFHSFEPVHCSMSSCVASCPAYRFLRRQVKRSSIPICLRIFHSLLWFTQAKTLAPKNILYLCPFSFVISVPCAKEYGTDINPRGLAVDWLSPAWMAISKVRWK